MTAVERRSCAWVLNALWAPQANEHTQAPLADTILVDHQAPSGFKWLFTDKAGRVRKKKAANATLDAVVARFAFLSGEDFVANLVTASNEFKPVSALVFRNVLEKGLLQPDQALQLQRPHHSSRISVYLSQAAGYLQCKIWKEYTVGAKPIRVTLAAQAQVECLKQLAFELVRVIERNSGQVIQSICLVFTQEPDRSLLFLGSTDCFLCTRSSTTILKKSRTSTLQRSSSVNKTLMPSRSLPLARSCAGDFCRVVVTRPAVFNRDARFALEYSTTSSESTFFSELPLKYVVLGKELINCTEVRVTDVLKLESPRKHTSNIYDTVKVCERCYAVYSLIRTLRSKRLPRVQPSKSFFGRVTRVNILANSLNNSD